MNTTPLRLLCAAAVVGGAHPATAATAQSSCSHARNAASAVVVELYTSEGCSSCPPADRWLSTLKGRPGVVALSFHVNYWDRLGWRDRFASPAYTERQREIAAAAGRRQVYTPQVLVNGQDWRAWPALPAATPTGPLPTVALSRAGPVVTAEVGTAKGSLAAYWAVLEDGLASHVRAGENAGETLRHDHVVRHFEPVASWNAAAPQRLTWTPPSGVSTGSRVVLVLTDASRLRPIGATVLDC